MRRRENICASIHLRFFIRQHRPRPLPLPRRWPLWPFRSPFTIFRRTVSASSGVKNLPEVLHLQFPFLRRLFASLSCTHWCRIEIFRSQSVVVFDCFVVLLALSCALKLTSGLYSLHSLSPALSFASVSCTVSWRIEFFSDSARVYECFWLCLQ